MLTLANAKHKLEIPPSCCSLDGNTYSIKLRHWSSRDSGDTVWGSSSHGSNNIKVALHNTLLQVTMTLVNDNDYGYPKNVTNPAGNEW